MIVDPVELALRAGDLLAILTVLAALGMAAAAPHRRKKGHERVGAVPQPPPAPDVHPGLSEESPPGPSGSARIRPSRPPRRGLPDRRRIGPGRSRFLSRGQGNAADRGAQAGRPMVIQAPLPPSFRGGHRERDADTPGCSLRGRGRDCTPLTPSVAQ